MMQTGRTSKSDLALYLVLAVCGGIIWGLIAAATGRSEAWDTGLYFSAGIPAVCILSFALGFFRPQRAWRWGVAPFAGQFVWMLVAQGAGNLLPLGIIMFGVLSIPAIFTAQIGARIALRRTG